MSIIAGYDATHQNVGHLPPRSQVAGYTTGSSWIRWTAEDWAAHPGAVRIDQDFAASDPSADVLDVERGAATFYDCPGWSKRAKADFDAAVRPGQRRPAIYVSASYVRNVANALVGGGVTNGVGLFVASWGIGEQQAIQDIAAAGGPFPIIAMQYMNGAFFDYDVFSNAWLQDVSGAYAHNPVNGLSITHRGYTSIGLAWDGARNATAYTVKAYWRGALVRSYATIGPSVRCGLLSPLHTYTFRVRAHPGGSTGSDAEIKSTTR